MDNILIRLKPELKKAIELIRKNAGPRFHVIAAESGSVLKTIPVGSLSACKIGFYSAKNLNIGGSRIEQLVSNAKMSAQWPKNIKYSNGVLFVDVDEIEIENEYTIEPDSNELGTIGTELIDDDEFGIWDGLSDDEIENETDENETE